MKTGKKAELIENVNKGAGLNKIQKTGPRVFYARNLRVREIAYEKLALGRKFNVHSMEKFKFNQYAVI